MKATRRPILLDASGNPIRRIRDISARFDAAQTTENNRRHWANADSLSADAVADPATRRILRERARYEVANNSYAKGIVLTKVNFCVSTGPILQVLTPDERINTAIERQWALWASAVNFSAKLRTLVISRTVDGEGFAILTSNPKVEHPVTLDIALVEADRVTENSPWPTNTRNADGIVFDEYGNKLYYKILNYHPGDTYRDPMSYRIYQAAQVIHTFRQDRPGQRRGIPEITPALPLFAQLRQYTQAVVDAARMAAGWSGWLYTEQAPDDSSNGDDPAFDVVEHERNTWQVAPAGYKAEQLKAEQPTTTHDVFVYTQLGEIARCLNMPVNIAAGNSGRSNMASARLDCQLFYMALDVDRADIELNACEPALRNWLREAALLNGVLPDGIDGEARLPHRWNWPGYPQPEPVREAQAFEILYEAGADTLTNYYARQGRDARTELEVWRRERAITHPAPSDGGETPGRKLANKEPENGQ